jgi:hypothetical protein
MPSESRSDGYISSDGYWWWDGARWLPLYPGGGYGQQSRPPKPWWQRTPTLIIAGVLLVVGSVGLGLTVLVGLAALTLYGVANTPSAPSDSSSDPTAVSGAPIDGINCASEKVTVHFHAHLALLQDGRQVTLPAGIGISAPAQCLYSLHTHRPDGLIHAESQTPTVYTLGQFFDIWGQPLSETQSGPLTVPARQPLHVYVDGTLYSGNPRDITLRSHQALVIEAGQVIAPPSFDFTGW